MAAEDSRGLLTCAQIDGGRRLITRSTCSGWLPGQNACRAQVAPAAASRERSVSGRETTAMSNPSRVPRMPRTLSAMRSTAPVSALSGKMPS